MIYFFLLFYFVQFITIFGLIKIPSENLLVENAKENVLYLFQYPRSSKTLCLDIESLKVETFLKMNKINFYRISNQFILSSSKGKIPFAQYNGEYIEGSDEIISLAENIIKQNKNIKIPKLKHGRREKLKNKILNNGQLDENIVKEFAGELFNVLMKDRQIKIETNLQFLLEDDALIEQFIETIPLNKIPFNINITNKNLNINTSKFWNAYIKFINIWKNGEYKENLEIKWKKVEENLNNKFKENNELNQVENKYFEKGSSSNINQEEEIIEEQNNINIIRENFLKKYVYNEMTANDWENFSTIVNYFLEEKLISIFVTKHKKLKNNSAKDAFEKNVIKIANNSKLVEDKFLFGDTFTELDAYLFSILIQLFDTVKIKDIDSEVNNPFKYKSYKEILFNYVERIKQGMGLDDEKYQKLKQKPWTLNYEELNLNNEKYDGPFKLKIPNLNLNIFTLTKENYQNIFNRKDDEGIINYLENKFNFLSEESFLLFKKIIKELIKNSNDLNLPNKNRTLLGHLNEIDEKINYFTPMLFEAFGFICKENNCREEFNIILNNYIEHVGILPKTSKYLIMETRKIVYNTIVKFNEEMIAKNVQKIINELEGKTLVNEEDIL